MYSTSIPVSLSHPCDVTDDTFILNDTSLSLGHTHSLFFLNYEICSTVIMWIPTHLFVLLLQEHPLLRESAGILQDAWWENRKGKQTSSSDHFIFFFLFFSVLWVEEWQNEGLSHHWDQICPSEDTTDDRIVTLNSSNLSRPASMVI